MRAGNDLRSRVGSRGLSPAKRGLVWALVALMLVLAAGMAQRQTVGAPHVHETVSAQAADHDHGHSQGHAHHPHLVQRLHDQLQAHLHAHLHTHWLQHWHAPDDTSVQALDTAHDATGSTTTAALPLTPVFGLPATAVQPLADSLLREDWPRAAAARLSRWGVEPPLRPPRA